MFRLINLSRQWAENQLCDNRKVFDKCNKWSRWNQKGWRGKCKNPDRLELITCPLIIWVLNSVGKWDSKKAPELVYIWEKRISLQTYSFTIRTKYIPAYDPKLSNHLYPWRSIYIFFLFFFLLSNGVLTTIISLLLALIKTIENNFKKYLQWCKEQPFSFIKYSG